MYVWIGTSGYSFPSWVGNFYPEGTGPARMLAHFCRHFPLVELNFTFYRPPTRSMLVRLAEKTPVGFQFIVKLPRSISHEESPRDLPGFRHAVEGLDRRGQLAGLLCQLPQATHCTRRTCDWIGTLAKELAHLKLSVEFRHRSWNRPGMPAWLAEKGVGLVAVDVPNLPGLFPRGWVQSGPTAYVRLHSRNAGRWYRSGEERYDYDFSDEEMGEWITDLRRQHREGGTERAMLLFNNCSFGRAAQNARRMQALLRSVAPEIEQIAPSLSPPPVQRSLFGAAGESA
jgi:uncharacterized protein YecE (DUF72 family)